MHWMLSLPNLGTPRIPRVITLFAFLLSPSPVMSFIGADNYLALYPCNSVSDCNAAPGFCWGLNAAYSVTIICSGNYYPGKWCQVQEGNIPCSPCSKNTPAYYDGTSCISVFPQGGLIAYYGLLKQSPSSPGFYYPSGIPGPAVACSAGYYCPPGPGLGAPIPCPLGTYTPGSANSQCFPCTTSIPANAFYNVFNDCTSWACNTGFTNTGTACACSTCSPGAYVVTACSAGVSTVCAGCPSGTYSTQSQASACTSCSNGMFASATGQSTCSVCTVCGAGTTSLIACTSTSDRSCTACAAGTYCPLGSSAAVPCPAGTYCPAGASAPLTCAIGTYGVASGE